MRLTAAMNGSNIHVRVYCFHTGYIFMKQINMYF